ncbi:hypothetical protein OESDEN_00842 [Oesophagostomum dentatum]|uniref:Endonuclease/exonuclease/phosphatase domain-containing protein n=1 Tax=Oesophagostomum dentatum TaxID=61180 RepID=A0A0B1TUT9_OESDE|nr:hypothetical protein OESDEN_00842 [Oesophagostomum dentatum]
MKNEHRRWTWESPNGTTHAEIDHILTNRRWCLLGVSVVPSFCRGSDHRLFQAKYYLRPLPNRRGPVLHTTDQGGNTDGKTDFYIPNKKLKTMVNYKIS